MKSAPLLLLGAGGHCRSCIDVIEAHGAFAIAGLIGVAAEFGREVLGYPVIGTDDDCETLLEKYGNAIVAVGQIKSPQVRMRLFELIERKAAVAPTIVSPRAYVSRHANVGAGTIVMHGAIVNAGAVIGRNCIVNSQALVEHDAVVEDHCHIATAAVVNGGATIGAGSFVGSGSIVRETVAIAPHSVIAMGQSVLRAIESGTLHMEINRSRSAPQ